MGPKVSTSCDWASSRGVQGSGRRPKTLRISSRSCAARKKQRQRPAKADPDQRRQTSRRPSPDRQRLGAVCPLSEGSRHGISNDQPDDQRTDQDLSQPHRRRHRGGADRGPQALQDELDAGADPTPPGGPRTLGRSHRRPCRGTGQDLRPGDGQADLRRPRRGVDHRRDRPLLRPRGRRLPGADQDRVPRSAKPGSSIIRSA